MTDLPRPIASSVDTVAERRVRGKACRRIITRTDQGLWSPAADRPDPVQFLITANTGRLSDVLPIKWARMAASPFGFFVAPLR